MFVIKRDKFLHSLYGKKLCRKRYQLEKFYSSQKLIIDCLILLPNILFLIITSYNYKTKHIIKVNCNTKMST